MKKYGNRNDVSSEHLTVALNQAQEKFGVARKDILGRYRNKPLPEARAYVARQLVFLGYSYPAIGRALGRDHTTIQYMVKLTMRHKKAAYLRNWYARKAVAK